MRHSAQKKIVFIVVPQIGQKRSDRRAIACGKSDAGKERLMALLLRTRSNKTPKTITTMGPSTKNASSCVAGLRHTLRTQTAANVIDASVMPMCRVGADREIL